MRSERDVTGWDAELQEIRALRADIAATQFIVRALILREALRKANFNRNQPREPGGQPIGGRWAPPGGAGRPAGTAPTGSTGDSPSGTADGSGAGQAVDTAPPRPRLHIEIWPSNGGPLEDPPVIPETPPPDRRTQLRYARLVARWLARGTFLGGPITGLLTNLGLEASFWLYDNYWPLIAEYLAPPKTLAELQQDVRTPRPGTDVHHIVEKGAAEAAGFPQSLIHGPDNLVRISRYRHWEATEKYASKNDEFPPTPREYLNDKSREERYQCGVKVLIEKGILTP